MTNSIDSSTPDGVDIEAFASWLQARISVDAPVAVSLISGGRSNLTYRVDSGDRSWILRRPPLGKVLATAHDMSREYRILSALSRSSVPVPKLVGFCSDTEVIGAPFYVMERVDGHVLRMVSDIPVVLPPQARRQVGLDLAATLSTIHAVDIDAVGLGTLGKREDYMGRQLRRWWRQYEDSRTHHLPDVQRTHELLLAGKPPQRRTSIVHGDYRLDNVIVGDDGRVRAVLDWELCALGDPMVDLGLLVVRSSHGQIEGGAVQPPVVSVPGMPDADAMSSHYSRCSGADLSDLDYYVAFALWKGACILQGVYSRIRAGAMPGQEQDAELVHQLVRERAGLAVNLLRRN